MECAVHRLAGMPVCYIYRQQEGLTERTAHIAKRDGDFYFVDDEYNPFVRHAPVKTTEEVFRFFANGYRREHGTEPEVTGNRKLSERDILSGMRQMLYDLSNE